MVGTEQEPEQSEDEARPPRHITMVAEPGGVALNGASAAGRTRVPIEPAIAQTRDALARRIGRLRNKLKAGSDKYFADRRWHEIDTMLVLIGSIQDDTIREGLLDGLAAALSLGLQHQGGPIIRAERTEAAVDAARTPKNIKDSVKIRMRMKRREIRYKLHSDTALAGPIVEDVSRDIDLMPAAPGGWDAYYRLDPPLASRPTTDPTRRKFKDALRKVIERMDT